MYVKKTTITDWTETLLEVLYSTLRKNEDDTAVKAVVADLKEAGFPVAWSSCPRRTVSRTTSIPP